MRRLAGAKVSAAQNSDQLRTMPSSAEILELVNKADEKVQVFDATIKEVNHYLDKQAIDQYTEAARSARTVIAAIQKNGISNYSLLALISALDDLTLDASRASRVIILAIGAHEADAGSNNAAMALIQSESSLYDISDLILHAGLRFAAAEDDIISSAIKQTK